MKDISSQFKPNSKDAAIAKKLEKLEGTPEAIVLFEKECHELSNYAYWFLLSTLWVSYSGFSDIELWKKLFKSQRDIRKNSIMKPSEKEAFDNFPYFINVYRAHRENETEWISYTTDLKVAGRFAIERNVPTVCEYKISKHDVIAFFLRRGEKEIIMLNKEKAEFVKEIIVSDEGEGNYAFYAAE